MLRFLEWFKKPFAKCLPDEDTMLTEDETGKAILGLKRVFDPFTLRREAKKTFQEKKEACMIWLPLSPWQAALTATVREKEVERWADTFGVNPMNGLLSVLRSCTTHPSSGERLRGFGFFLFC